MQKYTLFTQFIFNDFDGKYYKNVLTLICQLHGPIFGTWHDFYALLFKDEATTGCPKKQA